MNKHAVSNSKHNYGISDTGFVIRGSGVRAPLPAPISQSFSQNTSFGCPNIQSQSVPFVTPPPCQGGSTRIQAHSAPVSDSFGVTASGRIVAELADDGRQERGLKIVPVTVSKANTLILAWHRHHKPVVGHRFSLGASCCKEIVGVVVVGRPVARKTDQYMIAEVTRLATNGHKNACSFLYAASARVAKEMGFYKIQTFILLEETGVSLKAAGWKFEALTDSKPHKWHSRSNRRSDQPCEQKQRWAKILDGRRAERAA